jgi:hypothetical protein
MAFDDFLHHDENSRRGIEDVLCSLEIVNVPKKIFLRIKTIFCRIEPIISSQRRSSTGNRKQRSLKEHLQNDFEDFKWSKNFCKTSKKIFKMPVKIFSMILKLALRLRDWLYVVEHLQNAFDNCIYTFADCLCASTIFQMLSAIFPMPSQISKCF